MLLGEGLSLGCLFLALFFLLFPSCVGAGADRAVLCSSYHSKVPGSCGAWIRSHWLL